MKIGSVICWIDGVTIAGSMIKPGITLANDDMQGKIYRLWYECDAKALLFCWKQM